MQIIEEKFSEEIGKRLDVFVATVADISRSRAAQLIDEGNITVNGKITSKNAKPKNGDSVIINIPEPQIYDVKAENIPLDIVYEDEDLLVVNKPKGMVVHPAAGNYEGTLVNALMHHCGDSLSGINGVMRPGIVHRIDKNTSGLLMVAKNDFAHTGLADQIKEHSFTREYAAIVYGKFKNSSGIVNAPIDRHPQKRKQMAVVEGGREAVTHYEVLEELNGFTYLKLSLETGRTHQIRVHMAYSGHPLAGDGMYGSFMTEIGHQLLHCRRCSFVHPVSGENMELEAPLPPDFIKALNSFVEIV